MSTYQNRYTAIAVDPNAVYVAGLGGFGIAGHTVIIHKRSRVNGSILWTAYDDNMFDTNTFAEQKNEIQACVDSSGLYLTGNSDHTENGGRIKKLSLLDGSLLTPDVFSQPGNVANYPGGGCAVNSSNLFVSWFVQRVGPTLGWRIEKHDLTTLALIGADEYLDSSTTRPANPLQTICDENYVYIIGYETDAVSLKNKWRIEKRDAVSLGLIWAVNVKKSPENEDIWGRGIALYGDALYCVGDSPTNGVLGIFVKKISASTGADYGGGWHDVELQGIYSVPSYPAAISVSARGVYAGVTAQGRILNFFKINKDTGGVEKRFLPNLATFGNTYLGKVVAQGTGLFYCAALNAGSGAIESGEVARFVA